MPNLSYATTGPGALYNSIGWFNFASVPANFAGTTTLINNIKGGGTIQATFTVSNVSTASVPPLWNGATFGVTAYLNIPDKVCLRGTSALPTITTITVRNIVIKNKYGEPITNYNFYFMDSETPQASPPEVFTTNGTPWEVFYTLPTNPSFGNTSMTGIGTTIAQTNGTGNMPLLLTRNPSQISQTLSGGGAMTFGLSLTTAELRKVVTGRINPSDQFVLNISGPNSGTTITSGSSTGLQSQGVQVISGDQGQSVFTFNESMSPGSVSALTDYIQTIQVSNLSSGGTTLPNTITLGSSLTLNLGDYALVTIINSPPASAILNSSKIVNKNFALIGDVLTYTIPVSNIGTLTANNIVFIDTIPNGVTLVPGSFKQDGVPISGSSNPPGVTLPSVLSSSKTSTITFQVIITTNPNPNPIPNNASFSFNYFNGLVTIPSSSNTNTVNTAINYASLGSISKSVDKSFATCGDTLTYTIYIPNTGTVTALNVVFKDTIPNGSVFIANSLLINGVTISNANLNSGVTLPDLSPGSTATIVFQTQVQC